MPRRAWTVSSPTWKFRFIFCNSIIFSCDLFFQCKRKHYLLLLVLFLIASRRAWHERTSFTFSGRRFFHSRHSTFHYRFCHYRCIFSDATHNLCLAAISNTYFYRMGGKGIVIQCPHFMTALAIVYLTASHYVLVGSKAQSLVGNGQHIILGQCIMVALAVRRGFSFKSGLSAVITTS